MISVIPILIDNYAYIVQGRNNECVIIDSGESEPILEFIHGKGLTPTAILSTHHHGDHIGGNKELMNHFDIPEFLDFFGKNEITQAGITFKIIQTPGHTKEHVVFYAEELNALFSGDTLFSMGCGRLLNGTAEEMFQSLQKIKRLPPQTQIYCGHEYTKSNGEFSLHIEPENADIIQRMEDVLALRRQNKPTLPVTLETELKTNPFLRAQSTAEFAVLRLQKDSF